MNLIDELEEIRKKARLFFEKENKRVKKYKERNQKQK